MVGGAAAGGAAAGGVCLGISIGLVANTACEIQGFVWCVRLFALSKRMNQQICAICLIFNLIISKGCSKAIIKFNERIISIEHLIIRK